MVWTGPSIRQANPDPVLAELAARHGVKPERSRITSTDWLLTAVNRERLGASMLRRIVDLSCGHKAVTQNAKSMDCPRCAEMIRQGHDYEGWINNRQHTYDGMVWRDDPLRQLNERTDLSGSYLDEPAGEAAP